MQSRRHVLWPIRVEIDVFPSDWVVKSQSPSMQGLSCHARSCCSTVHGIAQERVPDMGHVDPYLVCSTRMQGASNQTALFTLGQ